MSAITVCNFNLLLPKYTSSRIYKKRNNCLNYYFLFFFYYLCHSFAIVLPIRGTVTVPLSVGLKLSVSQRESFCGHVEVDFEK